MSRFSSDLFRRSRVIETIRSTESKNGTVVAYHYCRFSDLSTTSQGRLVGSLICQIIQSSHSLSLPADLIKLFELYRVRSDYPSIDSLSAILEEQLKSRPKIYLVVDGLDEIQDRSRVLALLQTLASSRSDLKCKIFVSSRPEPDLVSAFQAWKHTVRITPSDIESDMRSYVAMYISQMGIPESEVEKLEDELVDRADGM